MAEHQDVGLSGGKPAADMYPRKILEYMEGFLISKVKYTRSRATYENDCLLNKYDSEQFWIVDVVIVNMLL